MKNHLKNKNLDCFFYSISFIKIIHITERTSKSDTCCQLSVREVIEFFDEMAE
jgi:hypothetical protein